MFMALISSRSLAAKELSINALQIEVDKNNQTINAEGKVEILDEEKNSVLTEKAKYNKKEDILTSIGKTEITTSENFKVTGKNISFNNKENVISSQNDAVIVDRNGNKIFVNMFDYLTKKNMFFSKGEIKVVDSKNNEYFFSEIYIDEKKRKIVGADIKAFFNDKSFKSDKRNEPRFFANSATIGEENTIFEKGVFTTCKNRKEGKCPPWTIKAKQIKHNSAKKTIYYDNAVIKVYDFPIFYFPRFFHPDPSVKRQSGFLVPKIADNSTVGFSTTVPYFWAISKNQDMTITPKLYAKENILFMNEYRRAFENAFLIVDSSYTEGYKKLTSTKTPGSRSHFFSKLNVDLAKDESYFSNLEVNIQRVSNDTYLKVHDVDTALAKSGQKILENNFNYEFQDDKNFFGLNASMFEDTSKEDNSRYEYVMPNFVFERNLITSEKIGLIDLHTNAIGKNYNVDQTTKFLVNDLSWKTNLSRNVRGVESRLEGLFKIVNYEATEAEKYKSEELNTELSGAVAYKASLPMSKESPGKNQIGFLTPKFSLRYAPGHMRNIHDDTLKLGYSNLFSINKNSQIDVIEKGTSIALGLEISNNDFSDNVKGEENYSVSIGQIYNLEENSDIPSQSSLDQKTSDLVGLSSIKLSKNIKLSHEFSLDHNFNDVNYNNLQADLVLGNTNFNLSFLEENNHVGSASYIKSDVQVKFSDSKELTFDLKKNLETDSTEFYNLAYNYINDCLKAGLVFRREFYTDKDVESSDSLMFKISLLPFGEISTPEIDR